MEDVVLNKYIKLMLSLGNIESVVIFVLYILLRILYHLKDRQFSKLIC